MAQWQTRLAVAAAAVAALTLGSGATRAQEFTMKFATQTLNDVQHEYIKVYKAELEKATNGRIKVDIYPAAQLGAAPRQTEGLRLGTIEAGIGPAELFVGADPRFQVAALAGLYKDREHLRRVEQNPEFRKVMFDIAAQRGLVGLALLSYDMQSFAFKVPVTKLSDFAGKRIRVLASPGEQGAVQAMGGAPVPMALPEVLPAIQQGTIDGVNSAIGVFVAFRYYDAAPHILDTGLWPILPVAVVSKVFFDKLPADLQKIVLETGSKLEPGMEEWQKARVLADNKAWLEKGGKIVKLSAAEQQEVVRKVGASALAAIEKTAPMKETYTKLKAIADGVN